MRPILHKIAKQQVFLETLARSVDTIANVAGIDLAPIKSEGHRKLASITRQALTEGERAEWNDALARGDEEEIQGLQQRILGPIRERQLDDWDVHGRTSSRRLSAATGGEAEGYVLPAGSDTNPEYPTRCTRCDRPVQRLSVFPGGKCIDCHADTTPMPTAQDVVEMWGGEWKGASRRHHANDSAKRRLEELRAEIRAERISLSEISELRSLAPFIDPGDTELLEWAGVSEFSTEAYRRHADTRNPANPIPEPAPEQAEFSAEETRSPGARVDVDSRGGVGVDGTGPDAQVDIESRGDAVEQQPLPLTEDDVEAPVAGTTDPVDARIEGEVRIGPKVDDEPFSELQSSSSISGARLMASIRLARQRIEAGLATGDDISLGHSIASSRVSDDAIATEIRTLERVARTSAPPVSRNLVPRSASSSRMTPSLAPSSPSRAMGESTVEPPLW